MHHLAADKRQRVDQHHVAVQPGRLDGRRQAGDPGADHAHVGADLVGGLGRGPGDLGELELRQGVRHQRSRFIRVRKSWCDASSPAR
jgi:hypothetical protein